MSKGVILDANVLFPASLRDTLLRAAAADLYRLHWTEEILEEVRRNLVAKRVSDDQAQRLITQMQVAFPDAMITTYHSLVTLMTNDPKDRHVLAAAVAAQVQIIVTFNLADFPQTALAPHNVVAQHPDDFLTEFLSTGANRIIEVLKEQAAALRRPSKTLDELLDTIAQHAPNFITQVKSLVASEDSSVVTPLE